MIGVIGEEQGIIRFGWLTIQIIKYVRNCFAGHAPQ